MPASIVYNLNIEGVLLMFLRSGRQLALRRMEMGISGYELAKMVGTKRPNISSWENGKQLPGQKFINTYLSKISGCLLLDECIGIDHVLKILNFEKYIFNVTNIGLFSEMIISSIKLAICEALYHFSIDDQSNCKITKTKSNILIPTNYYKNTHFLFNIDITIKNDMLLLCLNEIKLTEKIAKQINKAYFDHIKNSTNLFDIYLQENRRKKSIETNLYTLIQNIPYSQIIDLLLFFFYSIKLEFSPYDLSIDFYSEHSFGSFSIILSTQWNYKENCLNYELAFLD